jgi:hypothetical protein
MSSKISKSKNKKQTSNKSQKNQSIQKSKSPNKKINKPQNKRTKTKQKIQIFYLKKIFFLKILQTHHLIQVMKNY